MSNKDKRNYSLIYESVFNNDEIKKEFSIFLKKERNLEPFEFILEVEKIKNEKDFEEKAKEVYLKYIKSNSSHEINISNEEKQKFKQIFESKEIKIKRNVFDKLLQIIKTELKMDNYLRFTKSKECEKLIENNKKDETIVCSDKKKIFPYTNLDFSSFYITTKDIEFLDHISKDSLSWKLSYKNEKEKAYGFISSEVSDFLPNISFGESAVMIKYSLIYPMSMAKTFYLHFLFEAINLETLMYTPYENMKEEFEKLDDGLKKFNNSTNTDNYVRSVSCCSYLMSYFPIGPKYCLTSMIYDEKEEELKYYGKIMVPDEDIDGYLKKTHKKKIKTKKGEKEVKFTSSIGFSYGSFKKLDENRTISTNVTILTVSKNKNLTKLLMKTTLPIIVKNKIKDIKTKKVPKEMDFYNINDYCDPFWKDLILYKQVKDLMEYYKNLKSSLDDDNLKEKIIKSDDIVDINEKIKDFDKNEKIQNIDDENEIIQNIDDVNEKIQNIDDVNEKKQNIDKNENDDKKN
jgi:hypothetical protein